MLRLSMLLNTVASGPQAWLLLAQARGYVAEAGIELTTIPGTGAYNAAPDTVSAGHDLGYGDLYSLVEVVAKEPARAPVGVFAVFNASPSAIGVARNGPIARPGELVGRHLIGHASDVALRTFPAFAAVAGIDPAAVRVSPAEGSLAAMAARVCADEIDGVFGYVSTITAAMAAAGLRAEDHLRFLRYDQILPDFYGSLVMASRRLIQEEPVALHRLIGAFSRGLAEALAEPEEAMAALHAVAPSADLSIERLRWEKTLAVEMAHPEGRVNGYGAVDPARLARSIALHATTIGLPRIPAVEEIFSAAFLPDTGHRAFPGLSA